MNKTRLILGALLLLLTFQACKKEETSDSLSEYMVVRFVDARGVIVDGEAVGSTGALIEVSPGSHEVSLDGPRDYQPEATTIVAEGTNTLEPLEVIFEKK